MKTRKVIQKSNYIVIENGEESVQISYKENTNPYHPHDTTYCRVNHRDEILNAFNEVMIDALDKRLDACFGQLYKHTNNIRSANECIIVFKKDNGVDHAFNAPTFDCMIGCIEILKRRDYDDLNTFCLDQIIKSLFWIEAPADINRISFSNLISCLMEMYLFSDRFKS